MAPGKFVCTCLVIMTLGDLDKQGDYITPSFLPGNRETHKHFGKTRFQTEKPGELCYPLTWISQAKVHMPRLWRSYRRLYR